MKPRIAIVGAGAVGGYAGSYMAAAGEDVTFIDPWPEHVEAMRANGLRVTHLRDVAEFTTPVRALHITELQNEAKGRPFDIAFICMKSYDTAWATAMIAQYLAPGGYVHLATDWEEYALQVLEVMRGEPLLENTAEDFAPRPAARPETKFESRGLRLGHGVRDVLFRRRAAAP
jgi:threonine dehydrogenase-like Zn-dependent dehydrogenase